MRPPQSSTRSIEKFLVFFLVLGGIIWFGGINGRAVLSNHLLVVGTLEFKSNLDPTVEREVFRLINYSSILIFVGYVIVFVSGVVYLRSTPLPLKENGWLMMSALLFYMFSPVEIYTTYLDGRMISLELWGSGENAFLRELFIKRVAALKGLPVIALLCYYTIIVLAIWQPMKKRVEA